MQTRNFPMAGSGVFPGRLRLHRAPRADRVTFALCSGANNIVLAVSLALLMVLAQVLMTVHYWNLVVLQEVLCLLCLPSLIWQSWDHVRVRRSVE